jgi:hypothetical protein
MREQTGQRRSAIAAAPNISSAPAASDQPKGSPSTTIPTATAMTGLMKA